ncbi:MAG: CusA/CzcA family heavy metal efflux RND transporter [Deltaproteobacteria bacterium HGW-Deltaproteobacteria-19]|nr:MAG: CusA/CzcA family heavy metal efflux RND transporter [Deltaproteobacteria bacterium HGW-Deltaproteobacteria-19]
MINRIIEFCADNKLIVFLVVAAAAVMGWWSMKNLPLDAIPDLSETQVIIYSRWDRSPDIIEDQVTYPIVTAMLGAPGVRTVRGFSDFGYSFVYVIFEEGTDIYWARSRTQEYLATALQRLPSGVQTELGPDATGLGWVFQYVIEDTTGQRTLAELRSYQDWYLRYYLKAVPGVAEVAPIGGFRQQYQVNLDPNKLQYYNIPIGRVLEAVRGGNNDVGGRLVEFGGTEYMVRGRGYARSVQDFGNIAVAVSESGSPVRIRDLGEVVLGPDIRRGVSDWNGKGEAVSGIVIMRQGQNALDVIERVKKKLREIEPGLPPGMKIVPVYDRSDLIYRAIDNLKVTLVEIIITVSVVVLLFLWHIPSALIPILTIPLAVLISFIPFRYMGVTANIMSLAGIAIAVGAMVDAAIVVVEQTHKKLEVWDQEGRPGRYQDAVLDAIREVGSTSFFALLVIAVSFLPVLALEAQEGRLFKPLAYTKTLSMVVAAVLAITLDPALRILFTHVRRFDFQPLWLCRTVNAMAVGTIRSEQHHVISRFLIRIYEPAVVWSLRWKEYVITAAVILVLLTVPVFQKLGSEFMPPLDEGSLFYMPTTMPGISITEAGKLLQVTDRIIKSFPEVDQVLGKAGRAETSTDPAPLSMLETLVILKPKDQWKKVDTWYSSWAPGWLSSLLVRITPDTISTADLVSRMNESLRLPGLSNAWTMPIKGRIDMLTTGIRTPVGLKISGGNLVQIEQIGAQVETVLKQVQGTRSVFAERTGGGYFLDIDWNRDELARYGLSVDQAQQSVQNAIGGDNVAVAIQGRERYSVNVRYLRDFRSSPEAIGRVLVPAVDGRQQLPLSQLADVSISTGPAMIRDEDGMLTGYVYVDIAGQDPGSYIAQADRLMKEKLELPAGYAVTWSGQYEAMQRIRERLGIVVPLTIFLIVLLLYLNTRSLAKTAIVLLAVPFSAVGAVWMIHLLGYNMSIGVWVGFIALLGVDAEMGVFMLLYLDLAYERAKSEGRMQTRDDLHTAIVQGAAKRIRPKFMTVATMLFGLIPIMWSTGTGADVMKHIAAPLVGGVFTSFLMELLVYPPVYEIWKWNTELRNRTSPEGS